MILKYGIIIDSLDKCVLLNCKRTRIYLQMKDQE